MVCLLNPSLFEYEGDEGTLTTALERYNDDLLRAYYAESLADAEEILNESSENLEKAAFSEFLDFVEAKVADGVTIKY